MNLSRRKHMVTGTLINYYFHCLRQCWLHGNRINLEDNSEDVRIGKELHKVKEQSGQNTELEIDHIRIDKLTQDYLVEIKKSDADVQAVTWQTLYYLKILKAKGIERKGKIEFIEKNKTQNKIIYVELTKDKEDALERIEIDIEKLLEVEIPSPQTKLSKCKKCAYYEYCHI